MRQKEAEDAHYGLSQQYFVTFFAFFCKLLLSKSSLDVCSICANLLKLLFEQATTLPTELSLPFEAKGGSIYQQR